MEPPIALENVSFPPAIDLWDETLREGAERSPLSPSVDEKRELAIALSDAGVRSLVVGMFPDVPHNVELLDALLADQRDGRIDPAAKFVVISHLGVTCDQTIDRLTELEAPLGSVWILGIHSASDLQIEHLYPVIRRKDETDDFDLESWTSSPPEQRRAANADWLQGELERLAASFSGGGVAVGLLDAFRTAPDQLEGLVGRAERAGVRHVRLVDTAGTCIPQQIETHIRPLLEGFPEVAFYGHFHNDFGLATANAVLGLAAGLAGADVSVGGFANRAGHPALAEVAMSLEMLYGVEVPGLRLERLFGLSRLVERIYGLMESPTQPLTGVVTHGILSGIRTQLLERAPTIFDVIDPSSVGAHRERLFGVRSGTDGMRRFLSDHADELDLEAAQAEELAEPMYEMVSSEWQARSEACAQGLVETTSRYHRLLTESAALTEEEMIRLIKARRMTGAER